MNLNITLQNSTPVWSRPVEMVERKGKGHPDTICDALADELSNILSRFYVQRFGFILHHNVDKALLCGGVARAVFGGGEVLKPIEIYLAGRAAEEFEGVSIPVRDLVIEGARQWLTRNLHALDSERHVLLHCLIRPSSRDLADLYLRGRTVGTPLANDTSTGVGYAPLDVLETIVLNVERHLNSPAVKESHPEIGEDVKVMGVRDGFASRQAPRGLPRQEGGGGTARAAGGVQGKRCASRRVGERRGRRNPGQRIPNGDGNLG